MDRVLLRLYVHGTPSQRDAAVGAVERLRSLLEDETELEIIDVGHDPGAAERERVLATPTLDRIHPFNTRRTVGDLDDAEVVARHLGLNLRGTAERASAS